MTRKATAEIRDVVPFWMLSPASLAEQSASPDAGLSSAEAARRLAEDGLNVIADRAARTILTRVLRRLAEPLVAILLMAAFVSGATGDTASLTIILTIVAISVGLDVYQENGAEKAAEALRRPIALTVSVLRDGKFVELPTEQLVRGDVVRLGPGALVPADGIVLSSHGARVDEAIMTGEPYPVDKRPGPSGAADMADAWNALFDGTAVISGELAMIVAATGKCTSLGAISSSLAGAEPPTAFERGLHRLGLLILRMTLALVLFVLLVQITFHRPMLESVMFAVALAVGLTPELLPMITTVTLSRGAMRLAQRKVIVKRLAAIHDLGAMDVFCTDKTGTLTEARIELSAWPGCDGQNSARVLEFATVNSFYESGVGNPLDAAICQQAGNPATLPWRKLADLPFDFERRRAAVLVERDGQRLLIVKGAPEALLDLCDRSDAADGPAPLDAKARAALDAMHDARAANGERLLGVAWKQWPGDARDLTREDEAGLVFAGYCAFLDPPKQSAREAIARLQSLGVRVKVISGDAAPVVRHLVDTLELDCDGLLTGEEIGKLSAAALRGRVRRVDLYARVSPEQKLRIIRALSQSGHTVGYMGDGINDAPAIKAADAGMSVDGATDVARAAADMILLSNDLNVVADGVMEGRRTYGNIIKYVRMGTSSNFGNMLSMALAALVIPFLPMTAIQILLNNLLYDFSQLGIPFDNVDDAETARPHYWSIGAIERFTAFMGPLSSVFDIATFGLLLLVFQASPGEFRTAWFVESMLTQILVIFVIRTQARPWRSTPHRVLALTSLSALGAALLLALGPWAAVFGFAPMPIHLLGSVIALALTYLVLAEAIKRKAMKARG